MSQPTIPPSEDDAKVERRKFLCPKTILNGVVASLIATLVLIVAGLL